jgi:hypothetical protein
MDYIARRLGLPVVVNVRTVRAKPISVSSEPLIFSLTHRIMLVGTNSPSFCALVFVSLSPVMFFNFRPLILF